MAHNSDPEKIPTTSHGFFTDCIGLLTAKGLAEALGISITTAYRQAEDPDLTAEPVRNYLDKIKAVFRRLENIGRVDLAVSGLQFLADSIGMRVIPKSSPVPDKDSLEAELLDDLPHLAAVHTAIMEKKPLEEVERLAFIAIREIEEDVVKYKGELAK
ncbi:hypothetical protein [Maridesulfovibrio ferrireducens]|uniref:hypothetical protein n=1 Tax=Maridesulfovibrio ferrireducens TaxID=246191 RepID=UPI001A1E70DA|nr:hypothetical protein [Maridesulfovibrio ferrireducens]MBI9110262.1 hypothetical protein [Maridesulfovibrio ferrireducens]